MVPNSFGERLYCWGHRAGKLFRKVVLNPYSHAAPPNIARAEVEGAIAAVDQLLAVIDIGGMDGDPIQATESTYR